MSVKPQHLSSWKIDAAKTTNKSVFFLLTQTASANRKKGLYLELGLLNAGRYQGYLSVFM